MICRETPKNIEKIKKIAIFLSLNNAKALSPSASESDFFSLLLLMGTLGNVKEYRNKSKPNIAETKNWL